MGDLLCNIENIIGLEGAYLYNSKGKLVESVPNPELKDKLIKKILENMEKVADLEFEMNLKKCRVVGNDKIAVLMFTKNHKFVAVFDKSANFNLVNLELDNFYGNACLL